MGRQIKTSIPIQEPNAVERAMFYLLLLPMVQSLEHIILRRPARTARFEFRLSFCLWHGCFLYILPV